MVINQLFDNTTGVFETKTGNLVCVPNKKYGSVDLCFSGCSRTSFNVPFARIKLHSRDRAVDADVVFDDARKLGEEMARRWNESTDKQ
jgi:hypothetical protein